MRLSRTARVALVIANLLAIAFLVLPFVPVLLGSLQSEKSLQRDIKALLPREVTLANPAQNF